MPQHFNHPGCVWVVFFSLSIMSGTFGCSGDEAPVTEVKPDASAVKPKYDMGPAAKLPIPVTDIFRYMPEAPDGIRARPGDTPGPLIALKSVKLKKPFKRLYTEKPKSGPFKTVKYIIAKDGKSVQRVVATFHRQYARKDRHESIVEMIQMRLGKPKEVKTKKSVSQRWSLPEFGVEVRKDLVSEKYFSSAPLDLIYDVQTRSQPVTK